MVDRALERGPRRSPSTTDAGMAMGLIDEHFTDATLTLPDASRTPSRHASW
jgi:hypothetical protein